MYRVVFTLNGIVNDWLFDYYVHAMKVKHIIENRWDINVNVIEYGKEK